MEWIKYVVFSLIVIPVVLIGLWKTGIQRTVAFTAAGVLCLLFGSFLMNQPDEEDIKVQIQENVAAVKPYFAKEFPGEKGTISTVLFQKKDTSISILTSSRSSFKTNRMLHMSIRSIPKDVWN